MKKRPLVVVFASIIVMAIIASLLIPLQRERSQIRERVEMMRQALRNNDIAGVAALVSPKLRTNYQNRQGLQHFHDLVGTHNTTPSIWISGDKAFVTPYPQYYFGVIPGGTALEMIMDHGEWYFTGKFFID